MNILNEYQKEMLKIMSLKYPDVSIDRLKEIIKKTIIDDKYTKKIMKPDVRIYNNYTHESSYTTKLQLINDCLNKKYIMSGYGTLFYQHKAENKVNLNAKLINFLLADRKIKKKAYFTALNAGDVISQKKYQMAEKTDKLLNNSFYGATAEKNSQFFNPDIGPSITYTGVQIITSSILGMENFLSGNIKYKNFDDILIFINRVINEDYSLDGIIDRENYADINSVRNRIFEISNFNYLDKELNFLNNILSKLSDEELTKIYYKNNIYEFFKNSKPREIIKDILKNEIIKIEECSDEIKENAKLLWDMIKNVVFYNYQIYDRYKRALTMTRKTVLTIDTDSNFLSLDKWYNFCLNNFFDNSTLSNDSKRFTSVNSMIMIINYCIQDVLNTLTRNNNVDEDNQPTINMKNELTIKLRYIVIYTFNSFNCWKLLRA